MDPHLETIKKLEEYFLKEIKGLRLEEMSSKGFFNKRFLANSRTFSFLFHILNAPGIIAVVEFKPKDPENLFALRAKFIQNEIL